MTTATTTRPEPAPAAAEPSGGPSLFAKVLLGVFVAVPLASLVGALPLAILIGWVSVADIVMMVALYYIGVHGITIGYHRLFTHNAFKAGPVMRSILAVLGSVAVEGRVVDWVADHRKHHQFSDKAQDPHSPWAYGPGTRHLVRGFLHAHVGWLFTYAGTDASKYAPDLVADRALVRISRLWPLIALVTFVAPVLIGLAFDGWWGALRAFFWAGLVRVALVHHITWSINSITHLVGKRPFRSRDKSGNIGWAAILGCGENYHNYHHADPSSARHGVLRGQLDSSARIIRMLEKVGLVSDVKWPSKERVDKLRCTSLAPVPLVLPESASTPAS